MKLQKLVIKNFMSYGNVPTVIDFNNTDIKEIVGIIGHNGAGKSSIFDALFMSLLDKPFRQININSMINRFNKKDMYLSIEFENNNHNYKIERFRTGKSSNIKITEDDIEQKLEGHSNNIQTHIENNILGVNEQIFRQMFMIGLGIYKSFFKLTIKERRDIFEYILGLNVLSTMNEKLKRDTKVRSNRFDEIKQNLEHYVELQKLHKQKIEDTKNLSLKTNYEKEIQEISNQIKENEQILIETDFINLQNVLKELDNNIQTISDEKSDLMNKIKKIDLKEYIEEIDGKIEEINTEKEKNKIEVLTKIKELEKNISELNEKRVNLQNIIAENELQEYIAEIKKSLEQYNIEQNEYEQKLTKNIENINEDLNKISQEKEQLTKVIQNNKTLMTEKEKLIGFFNKNDVCPTCTQSITKDFKNNKLTEFEKDVEKLTQEINKCVSENEELKQKEQDLKNNKINNKNLIEEKKKEIKQKEQELNKEKETQINTVLTEKTQEIKQKEQELKKNKEELSVLIDIAEKEVRNKTQELQKQKELEINKIYDQKTQEIKQKELELKELRNINSNKLNEYTKVKNNIDLLNKQIKMYEEKEISNKKNTEELISKVQNDISELKKKIKGLKIEGAELVELLSDDETLLFILSDKGIKKYIYDIILDKLNYYMNENLVFFDFSIKCILNSELDEEFYYRKGEKIKFDSFSNGEKMIIEFSFMFALQRFLEEFYGFSLNYMFFDEILDSSIDEVKSQYLINYLKKMNKNVIIITHKPNYDFFDRKYVIKKEEFTTIEVIA